ncbi:MAG: hypothetical protein KGD57_07465 [Candidatus Lokiarchaeota archaeon]|nr:hypothetical protein [Candidatus Lokiarchaeota archaeon]
MNKDDKIIISCAEIRTEPFIYSMIHRYPNVPCDIWIFSALVLALFVSAIVWIASIIIVICIRLILYKYAKKIIKRNLWDTLSFEQDKIWLKNNNQNRTMDIFVSDIKKIELRIRWSEKINYYNSGSGPGLLLRKFKIHFNNKKSSKIRVEFVSKIYNVIFKDIVNQLHDIPIANSKYDENNITAIQYLYAFLKNNPNINVKLKFRPNKNVPTSLLKLIKKYELI